MTLEQLQYFEKIAQVGTFSRAAEELHISQSALSKQIARLEREINTTLFDRTHRQITLTTAGSALLEDAKQIVSQYQTMLQKIASQKKDTSNILRIAMLPVVSQYNISKRITDFKRCYPDIQLDIHEYEERDISKKIKFHDFDIIIIRDEHEQLLDYEHVRLYQDSLVAILAKQHPLAKAKSMDIHALEKEELLLPPIYFTMCKIALKECLNAGFKANIKRHGRFETILTLAAENQGIALAMKHSLKAFQQSNLKILPFKQPIHSNIMLYFRKDTVKKENIHRFLSFF